MARSATLDGPLIPRAALQGCTVFLLGGFWERALDVLGIGSLCPCQSGGHQSMMCQQIHFARQAIGGLVEMAWIAACSKRGNCVPARCSRWVKYALTVLHACYGVAELENPYLFQGRMHTFFYRYV